MDKVKMFESTDSALRDSRESSDLVKCRDAFRIIMSGVSYDWLISGTTVGCSYDFTLKVHDKSKCCGEIKCRTSYIAKYNRIPLNADKFTGLRRNRPSGLRLLYLAIYPDEWYLFDIDKCSKELTLECLEDWKTKYVEYEKEGSNLGEYWCPTIWLPKTQAIFSGLCENGEIILTGITSDKSCTG